jgi:hypothetical protein
MNTDYQDWKFDNGRWTKIAGSVWSDDELDPNEFDESDEHVEHDDDEYEGPLWVIDVLPDGSFSVFESHHSLTDRKEPFNTFAEAVSFCDACDHERSLRRNQPQSSGPAAASPVKRPVTEPAQKRKNQRDLPFV